MIDTDQLVEQTVKEAVETAALVLSDAQSIEITNSEDYHDAGEFLLAVKSRLKTVETTRKGIVQPIQDGIRRINALFQPALDALTEAQHLLSRGMVAWTTEQDRIRAEANRKAAEVAAAEARRLAARAQKAEEKGDTAKAAVLQQQAQTVQAPPPAPLERAAGTTVRRTWRAELTDKAALIAAVAAGTVSANALDVNMTYLNQIARADKSELRIPGVKAVADDTVVATAQ